MRWLVFLAIVGCRPAQESDSDPAVETDAPDTETPEDTDPGPASMPLLVRVTVDGLPEPDVVVIQGGTGIPYRTGPDGSVLIEADRTVEGDLFVIASHPECRQSGESVPDPVDGAAIDIALTRYDPQDNEDYAFQDPGDPDRDESTAQCAHCHVTLTEAWYASPHRQSASNPAVHDLYAGVAAAFTDELACTAKGGEWREGIGPGTGSAAMRCYVGDGALPALNPDCAEAGCDGIAVETGACADCHAPGIDGELGGRDLLEATGHAYDYGVHCDVCHRVDRVEIGAGPGVSGSLVLHRPSEESSSPGLGEFQPLTFGPWDDSPNVRMGSVQRDLFHEATLCAGCHLYEAAPAVPGAPLDASRWPEGLLPVQSTWTEWEQGPFSDEVVCTACHMPPDPLAGNGVDLGNVLSVDPGIAAGWMRPPGSVRRHSWVGPRQPESGMLGLAAALFVEARIEGGDLIATVTTKNVGAGHAIPTGEPLRSLVLQVEASCEGSALVATGGDAVPEFGGWLDVRSGGDVWPGAEVGDVLRVVRRAGFHDYDGFGPFGDGRFDAAGKGIPVDQVAGSATVTQVTGDVVTLDQALPDGDLVYRVRSGYDAGAPGFAFARVMAAGGRTMVPHFLADDVVADNRLLPQESWTTNHRFQATCEAPVVTARLIHRPFPTALVAERGWVGRDQVMVEVTR